MRSRVLGGLNLALGVLMLVGVALNFANVVSRYFLSSPIFWTEEVLVLITVWGVFMGIIVIAWNGEHLSMDLLSPRMGRRMTYVRNALLAATLAGTCAFVAMQSWKIVGMFVETGAISVGAEIPRAIPHAALLLGFALTAVIVLVRIRAYITGKFKT
jgi:TRAP-type transport system small permease protein